MKFMVYRKGVLSTILCQEYTMRFVQLESPILRLRIGGGAVVYRHLSDGIPLSGQRYTAIRIAVYRFVAHVPD